MNKPSPLSAGLECPFDPSTDELARAVRTLEDLDLLIAYSYLPDRGAGGILLFDTSDPREAARLLRGLGLDPRPATSTTRRAATPLASLDRLARRFSDGALELETTLDRARRHGPR